MERAVDGGRLLAQPHVLQHLVLGRTSVHTAHVVAAEPLCQVKPAEVDGRPNLSRGLLCCRGLFLAPLLSATSLVEGFCWRKSKRVPCNVLRPFCISIWLDHGFPRFSLHSLLDPCSVGRIQRLLERVKWVARAAVNGLTRKRHLKRGVWMGTLAQRIVISARAEPRVPNSHSLGRAAAADTC